MAVLALKGRAGKAGRAGRAGRGGMAGRAVMAVMAAGLVAGSLQAQQAAPPAVRPSERVAAGGNLPPGDSLSNPFAGDSAAIAEGAKLFDGFNCTGCHAGAGPALNDGRWKYGGTDGEIYTTIFYGRARGMPAYGGAVPSESIWRIVAWLRASQRDSDSVATRRW